MKTAFLNAALACALIAGTAPIFASPAAAKSTFMTDCSAKYKAGKADGSVAADAKWTDFMKTSCSAAPAQAASANAAAPMQAVAAVQPAPVKQMKSPAAPAAIVPQI